jgi:hypothetical protein
VGRPAGRTDLGAARCALRVRACVHRRKWPWPAVQEKVTRGRAADEGLHRGRFQVVLGHHQQKKQKTETQKPPSVPRLAPSQSPRRGCGEGNAISGLVLGRRSVGRRAVEMVSRARAKKKKKTHACRAAPCVTRDCR